MSHPEPKSKRLLIFFYDLGIGGIQRRLVDIIEYLQSESEGKRVKVTLYIKSYSGNRHNQEYIQRIETSGARIIYRPRWTAGPFRIGTFSHIIWTTFRVRPDVIMTHLRLLSVGMVIINKLFWWRKTAVVLNEGILPSEHLSDEIPKWRRGYWGYLMKWAYSRADRIIVPTRAVKRDLINTFQIPSPHITIARHWTLADRSKKQVFRKKTDRYHLIYIGRLEPQKNISWLIDAVRILQKKHPSLRACIVGTGSLKGQLQKEARKKTAGAVEFVGMRQDVMPYLERSKIFILTSLYEGMPIALLEAKSVGIPAVISNFQGADEVVNDGKDGFICQSKKEFIELIHTLIIDEPLRKRLGKHAKIRAEREFGVLALRQFCRKVIETKKKEA